MTHRIVILAGDGIGPEITQQARRLLDCLKSSFALDITYTEAVFGGAAYDRTGTPLPQETLSLCREADAILLGAIGAPQYDQLPRELRPESGLLQLRSELGVFANLRPAMLYPELIDASPVKQSIIEKLDLLIVRELVGGIYFGQPRLCETVADGTQRALNTMVYSTHEIERIGRRAFEIAQVRRKRLCSVDKANVLEVSGLWREVMESIAGDYPDVALSHLYVDNAAMQLVSAPSQFDVIVTGNLFGDILSDLSAVLVGSIGMLPSASLNETCQGLYEPVHGSAPDIAGQNCANPIATMLSVAMMLRHSLARGDLADCIEQAVQRVLAQGLRTADLTAETTGVVGTTQMGDAIIHAVLSAAAR